MYVIIRLFLSHTRDTFIIHNMRNRCVTATRYNESVDFAVHQTYRSGQMAPGAYTPSSGTTQQMMVIPTDFWKEVEVSLQAKDLLEQRNVDIDRRRCARDVKCAAELQRLESLITRSCRRRAAGAKLVTLPPSIASRKATGAPPKKETELLPQDKKVAV